MKLNWVERWFVNSPIRLAVQSLEMQWFKKHLALEAGAEVLEVGCGRGAGAGLILANYAPAHLYLLDLDILMIEKARIYLSEVKTDSIVFGVANVNSLPFEDGCLDAVFGFGFLHHVLDWRRGLHEIARVLKKGGAYCIEELYPSLYQNFITKRLLVHPEYDRFKSKELHDALTRVNLNLTHTLESKYMGILGIGIKN